MPSKSEQFKHIILSMLKCSRSDLEKKFKNLCVDITPFQYTLIALLEGKPMTLNELAYETANKPPTLIPALNDLETEDCIVRHRDDDDRRKVILKLTTKGTTILKKIKEAKQSSPLEKGFKALGPDKSDKLLTLLKELSESVITK